MRHGRPLDNIASLFGSRRAKDRLAYDALCGRVEEIDAEAARWLREEAAERMRPDFGYSGCLAACFLFERSPQGYDFWHEINEALKKEGDE